MFYPFIVDPVCHLFPPFKFIWNRLVSRDCETLDKSAGGGIIVTSRYDKKEVMKDRKDCLRFFTENSWCSKKL
jgi:hypothetical protein